MDKDAAEELLRGTGRHDSCDICACAGILCNDCNLDTNSSWVLHPGQLDFILEEVGLKKPSEHV